MNSAVSGGRRGRRDSNPRPESPITLTRRPAESGRRDGEAMLTALPLSYDPFCRPDAPGALPTAIRALGSRVFRPARHAAGRLGFAGAHASIVKQLVPGAETKNAPPASCAGGASGRSRGAGRSYGTVPSHPARSCPIARPKAGRADRVSRCRSLTRLIDSSRFVCVETRQADNARRSRETSGPKAARPGRPLSASVWNRLNIRRASVRLSCIVAAGRASLVAAPARLSSGVGIRSSRHHRPKKIAPPMPVVGPLDGG